MTGAVGTSNLNETTIPAIVISTPTIHPKMGIIKGFKENKRPMGTGMTRNEKAWRIPNHFDGSYQHQGKRCKEEEFKKSGTLALVRKSQELLAQNIIDIVFNVTFLLNLLPPVEFLVGRMVYIPPWTIKY